MNSTPFEHNWTVSTSRHADTKPDEVTVKELMKEINELKLRVSELERRADKTSSSFEPGGMVYESGRATGYFKDY